MEKMENEKEILGKLDEIFAVLKNQKDVMNLDQFCEYSGLSYSSVYELTSSNSIAFYRPTGKLIFFEKGEVDKWLLSNRVRTYAEIVREKNN